MKFKAAVRLLGEIVLWTSASAIALDAAMKLATAFAAG
jgi:hypothetical protein